MLVNKNASLWSFGVMLNVDEVLVFPQMLLHQYFW